MKKFVSVVICALFFYSVYSQFHAVYIPSEKLVNMRIDGKSDDWDWVPEKYYILTDNMTKDFNDSDKNWSCKIIVGWNDITNYIYIITIVDDIIKMLKTKSNEKVYCYNNLQLAINPGNSKERYAKKAVLYYNVLRGDFNISLHDSIGEENIAEPSWLKNNDTYLLWRWKVQKSRKMNFATVINEQRIALWDEWNNNGTELSKRHILCPDQIIGLTIVFCNWDYKRKRNVTKYITATGSYKRWWDDTHDISQFILDAPLDSKQTWDGIYDIIKPRISE